jgi:Prohead core protein serine protease
MKLLCEITEDYKVIEEASVDTGKKSLYVEGIFMQGGIKNRNGRMYPVELLAKEVNRYCENYVSKNRATGELGHPQTPTINPDRISHKFVSIKQDGGNFIGKAKLTESTTMGATAAGLIRDGVQLGISSRGVGSLKANKDGIMEVQEDFMLATAGDLVTDPSAPDAWLNAVMEDRDWIFDVAKGEWICRVIEETKAAVKKASTKTIEEQKLYWFDRFLAEIGKTR